VGGCGVLTPENELEGSEYVLTLLLKMSFFYSKLSLYNSASFTSSRLKDLCQKWKVKLIFRDIHWLPGNGIVKCLEIVDVGCNLKQSDGLTWLILPPDFTTDLCHC